MRTSLFLVLALNLGFVVSTAAQTRPTEDVGTVTGHILCSDTQRPARLAEVRLVPTSITASPKVDAYQDLSALGGNLPPVQTDMSGAFTVHNVHPGTYYLRVDYPGYLTSMLSFTRNQLAHPTPDIQKRIASELQVLYDDGSPAVGLGLSLYRRNDKGEFKEDFGSYRFNLTTDDRGHYHIDSLPADSFVLSANFSINESTVTTMPTPGGNGTMQVNIQKTLFSLPLYSGSVLRRRDATVIKTDAGQETPAVDLTMPLSKLHSVSGTVITQGGHTVNAGKVALLYADTREELTNTPISRDDNQFHFLYVPEGNYILAVKEASDVTQIEVANPPGTTPRMRMEDKTLRIYGTTEQPLTIEGEMPSVFVTVPNKADANPS
jgi:hypothetical protein